MISIYIKLLKIYFISKLCLVICINIFNIAFWLIPAHIFIILVHYAW